METRAWHRQALNDFQAARKKRFKRAEMRVSSGSQPHSYFNYQYFTTAQAIMRQDDRCGVAPQCRLHYFSRMDGRGIDGALEQHLNITDDAVAGIELCGYPHNSIYVQRQLM